MRSKEEILDALVILRNNYRECLYNERHDMAAKSPIQIGFEISILEWMLGQEDTNFGTMLIFQKERLKKFS